ncbi:LysM peptidoglycan-binding domain-containing protein [Motiliproteus coralliicola]|uniref:LysM peptidoglycan-binding domain-containing protein n=1 Tax=Motiliproteus coralliicola TaxID=2283196 RepID=A0A369WQ30_9GAMM|nr:LysM peptidoglycan-binding domain-containing protein [Motiliproteus coralliicola]
MISSLLLNGCQTLTQLGSESQPTAEPEAKSIASTSVASTKPTLEQQLAVPVITPAYQQFNDAEPAAQQPTTESVSVETEPVSDDLWQRTREHFALDHNIDQPRIQSQLKWYSRHPKYLDRMADRASRYYYYVLEQVISRGMPAELALLPIVESAYDPFAYSHGRAAGPWQFIPMTAKRFKLKHSWWYDGRRDIQASTKAALDYLELLNKRFDGDWLLALAAYNAGGGNVSKAIRKNRERNKPTDFWSLKLPKETSAYVPKLLALAKLFDNPQAYGLSLKPLPNRPYFAAVDTGSQIDLAKAAELADISIEELYLLNPGFNQWATDPQGPHQLLVPVEKADGFRHALDSYPPEKRVSWARYKVRSGDSLIAIAKRNNTTVETIRTSNKLRGNTIRIGQMLLIPKASAKAGVYAYSQGQRQQQKNQRIALRSGKAKLNYKVRSGDSFWKIARAHGVGVRQLAAWNQMAPGDPLRIGQKLVIWQPAGTVSNRSVASNDSRKVVRKIGYRVRSGDSFARIAGKFNVSLNDIKRWNSKAAKAKYLKPGQMLTLYVDVTQIRN